MADSGENRQSIGERLLALRNKNNLTQEELAERLMVSRQSVSKWELSKTLPDVDKLIQLSEMYQVSMDYLIIGRQSGGDAGRQETTTSFEGAEGQETAEQVPAQKTQELDESEDVGAPGDGDTSGDTVVQSNGKAPGEGDSQESAKKNSIDRVIRRSSLLVCMLLSGILFVFLLFFSVRLLLTHTYTTEGKKQDLAQVERVHEQYTKAEVTFFNEDGFFVNKSVWLDIPGVREGDYVYYFYDGKDPNAYSFEYYMRTLLVPVIGGIICLIFFITFCMEWRKN